MGKIMALDTHVNHDLLLKQIVAEEITNLHFLLSPPEAENHETSIKRVNITETKMCVVSRNHNTQPHTHYLGYEFPHFSCHSGLRSTCKKLHRCGYSKC